METPTRAITTTPDVNNCDTLTSKERYGEVVLVRREVGGRGVRGGGRGEMEGMWHLKRHVAHDKWRQYAAQCK